MTCPQRPFRGPFFILSGWEIALKRSEKKRASQNTVDFSERNDKILCMGD
jgi:hypothetical protein